MANHRIELVEDISEPVLSAHYCAGPNTREAGKLKAEMMLAQKGIASVQIGGAVPIVLAL